MYGKGGEILQLQLKTSVAESATINLRHHADIPATMSWKAVEQVY